MTAASSFDEPRSSSPNSDFTGSPRLPMLLHISGDGKPSSPFHLDLNDVLNSSIPSLPVLHDFVDNRWVYFVMSLNEQLRTVNDDFLHSCTELKGALTIIERCNASDYLKGLKLELLFVWPNAHQIDQLTSHQAFEQDEEALSHTVRCFRIQHSNARLALKITKHDSMKQADELGPVDTKLEAMEMKRSEKRV